MFVVVFFVCLFVVCFLFVCFLFVCFVCLFFVCFFVCFLFVCFLFVFTPRTHARARGYVIGRGVYIYYYCLDFFWNQSFISKNTHFERSILTQIGFSSNLMASGTA